jgi:imidazolonepropionase
LGLPAHVHAGQLSDMGAAELAAKWGALSADHLEYLSADGARRLAAAGTVAVLLPTAYFTLRQTTPPPIALLRDAGRRWRSPPIAIRVARLAPRSCSRSTWPALFGLTAEEA